MPLAGDAGTKAVRIAGCPFRIRARGPRGVHVRDAADVHAVQGLPRLCHRVTTTLHADHEGNQYIRRTVAVDAPLDAAQRTRLAEICEKTPVTLLIKRGTRIDTTMMKRRRRPSGLRDCSVLSKK
jgi:hypothetical protein